MLPRENFPGANHPGGNLLGGNHPEGQIYGEKFSGHHSEVMENLNITENELKQSAVLSGYQHFKNMNIITKHLMALDAGQSFNTKKSTKRGKCRRSLKCKRNVENTYKLKIIP